MHRVSLLILSIFFLAAAPLISQEYASIEDPLANWSNTTSRYIDPDLDVPRCDPPEILFIEEIGDSILTVTWDTLSTGQVYEVRVVDKTGAEKEVSRWTDTIRHLDLSVGAAHRSGKIKLKVRRICDNKKSKWIKTTFDFRKNAKNKRQKNNGCDCGFELVEGECIPTRSALSECINFPLIGNDSPFKLAKRWNGRYYESYVADTLSDEIKGRLSIYDSFTYRARFSGQCSYSNFQVPYIYSASNGVFTDHVEVDSAWASIGFDCEFFKRNSISTYRYAEFIHRVSDDYTFRVLSHGGRGSLINQCTNNIDDDGDGLVDELDPECSLFERPRISLRQTLNSCSDVLRPVFGMQDSYGLVSFTNYSQSGHAYDDNVLFSVDGGQSFHQVYASQIRNLSPQKAHHFVVKNDVEGYSYDLGVYSIAECVEVCDNGMDDDGDGLIDCMDEDCPLTYCKEQCSNGIDDDRDGLVDCGDPDCFAVISIDSTSYQPNTGIQPPPSNTLIASSDAFISSLVRSGLDQANSNYGNSNNLTLGYNTFRGTPYSNRTYLEFPDLCSYTNIEIDSAFLYFYPPSDNSWEPTTSSSDGNFSDAEVDLYLINQKWEEDSITWNNAPTLDLSKKKKVPFLRSLTESKTDVTNLIRDYADSCEEYFGFMLRYRDERLYRRINYASKEHPDPARHPRLVIYRKNSINIMPSDDSDTSRYGGKIAFNLIDTTLEYSLDGVNFQKENFDSLAPGNYTIYARSADSCITIITDELSVEGDPLKETNCGNGIDDDDDGLIDCDDPDCAPVSLSPPLIEQIDCSDYFPGSATFYYGSYVTYNLEYPSGSIVSNSSGSFGNLRQVGTYTLEVLTSSGCTDSLTFDIVDYAQPVEEVLVTVYSCASDSNRVEIIPPFDDSIRTYYIMSEDNNLSISQDSAVFYNLPVGAYTGYVYNVSNCGSTFDFSICVEICGNGIDDDENGLIDCEDDACDLKRSGEIVEDTKPSDKVFKRAPAYYSVEQPTCKSYEGGDLGSIILYYEFERMENGSDSDMDRVVSTPFGDVVFPPGIEQDVWFRLDDGVAHIYPEFDQIPPGMHTVSVENEHGCQEIIEFEIISLNRYDIDVLPSIASCDSAGLFQVSIPSLDTMSSLPEGDCGLMEVELYIDDVAYIGFIVYEAGHSEYTFKVRDRKNEKFISEWNTAGDLRLPPGEGIETIFSWPCQSFLSEICDYGFGHDITLNCDIESCAPDKETEECSEGCDRPPYEIIVGDRLCPELTSPIQVVLAKRDTYWPYPDSMRFDFRISSTDKNEKYFYDAYAYVHRNNDTSQLYINFFYGEGEGEGEGENIEGPPLALGVGEYIAKPASFDYYNFVSCYSPYITFTIEDTGCQEICDNLIDDDGDGLIDCADPDCLVSFINDINIVPTSCIDDSSSIVEIVVGEGDGLIYSIDSIQFQESPVFSYVGKGEHVAYVTNAGGCIDSLAFTVEGSYAEQMQITTDWSNCSGTVQITIDNAEDAEESQVIFNGINYGSLEQNGSSASLTITDIASYDNSLIVFDKLGCSIGDSIYFTDSSGMTPCSCSGLDEVQVLLKEASCEEGARTISISTVSDRAREFEVYLNNEGPYLLRTLKDGASTRYTYDYELFATGTYSVRLQDDNGCSYEHSIAINSLGGRPQAARAPMVKSPTCTQPNSGQVTLYYEKKGASTLTYSLDGVSYQSSSTFENLSAGMQSIYIRTDNGCVDTVVVELADPICTEICDNGMDDDQDGLLDCDDPDCLVKLDSVSYIQPTCSNIDDGVIELTISNMSESTSLDVCDLDNNALRIENVTEGEFVFALANPQMCYSTSDTIMINIDPSSIGTSCDDGDPCTINDIYDADCNCVGTFVDSDSDGVCDANDVCPEFDDLADSDLDGIPDGCDVDAPCSSIIIGNEQFEKSKRDNWNSNLVINLSDVYVNETDGYQNIEVGNFSFFAARPRNSITPFVVKFSASNVREVISIGSTITSDSYQRGRNDAVFSGEREVILVAPGDTLLAGFMDAAPDGTGGGIRSVVKYKGGSDRVLHMGGNQSAQISLNSYPPTGQQRTRTRTRNYAFSIDLCAIDADVGSGAEQCDVLNLNDSPFISYTRNKDRGTATILDSSTVLIANDAQKAFEVNYTITPNTVLKFDFWSTSEGQSHSIGLDNNTRRSARQLFHLYGRSSGSQNTDFDTYNRNGLPAQITIPIGQYYQTGNRRYLILTAVGGSQNPNSYFSNISLFEDADADGKCD